MRNNHRAGRQWERPFKSIDPKYPKPREGFGRFGREPRHLHF